MLIFCLKTTVKYTIGTIEGNRYVFLISGIVISPYINQHFKVLNITRIKSLQCFLDYGSHQESNYEAQLYPIIMFTKRTVA